MKPLRNLSRVGVLALMLMGTSACTTLTKSDDLNRQISNDPLIGLNRSVYAFNNAADKAILKPVAKAYHAVLPDPIERSVGRFFNNLGEPLNIVNNLLQGKVDGALQSTYRFTVNSTLGILGLFDVAGYYNVAEQPEDFGQTLAAWGVKPGPYVMLPFLGPTNFRDGIGRVVESASYYPINEITDSGAGRSGLFLLNLVDTRVGLFGQDEALDNQIDPYLFLKEAYDNSRINSIYDGNPPERSDEDLEF